VTLLDEILGWGKKPKELVLRLAGRVKRNAKLIAQLAEGLEHDRPAIRGTCAEALSEITRERPDLLPARHLDALIRHLQDENPRVKWETAQVIGNVAARHPEKVGRAVSGLLRNSSDAGTVVRWSSAYALTRIAEQRPQDRKALAAKMEGVLRREKNSGVRNVYLKALKKIRTLT